MNYAPVASGAEPAVAAALSGAAAGIAVATSGSTGTPREVWVSTRALRASADATHEALGGSGQWLLAVPETRIAGAMVLVRAAVAGVEPRRLDRGPFTAESFVEAVNGMNRGSRRYVSLVPTQLERLVTHQAGCDALTTFDAVLVGGATLLRDKVPSNVVTTYGASETAGGCVYDGTPLGETRVRIVDGHIHIAGPTLADGYADGDNTPFIDHGGERWFVTSDLGEFTADGRLKVLGRADDMIVSGGAKVHPAPVEAVVQALPWVDQAVVVGVPDTEWGELLAVLVVARRGAHAAPWAEDRAFLTKQLPRESVPKTRWVVDALPRLESGKIDRVAAKQLAKRMIEAGLVDREDHGHHGRPQGDT